MTETAPRSRRLRRAVRVVHDAAIIHDDPSPRARAINVGVRLTVKPLLRVVPLGEEIFRKVRGLERYKPTIPHPQITNTAIDLGGVPAEEMVHVDGPTSDVVILYFHGGGFFSGSINTHRSLTERLALATGGRTISVGYRQLPEAHLAESVQDAITAYEAALERTDGPIVVAGDSAGGYLATKVAELATRRGLRPPAGLIGFSPLLSIDPERTDKFVLRVSRERDAYLPRQRVGAIRTWWLPDEAMIEGFASPLHASAYIRCPVHLVAVEDEFLRPEVEAFAVLLTDKGVDVELHIWRGQVHAFPSFVDLIPDAEEAIELAAAFARSCAGQSYSQA